MHTEPITLDRERARVLWRDYRKHQHWSQPIDDEVSRTYHALAQGKVVIRALESMKVAGLDAGGLPRLALVRADAEHCWLQAESDGSAVFTMNQSALHAWRDSAYARQRINMPRGSFAFTQRKRACAIVPTVPLPLRPKRGLENYHILFEAEWMPVPPKDPMLLRRVGKADLWIVCAAWDLTEVEQAALAARIMSA
ncbi:hypothetical protein VAR608DRAFT_4929 [Variovorax sp. HW608]|uniref:hypothetical protein n=1 Tax=Variovorax sp. HW608 TaxID=1034889 RepID=UPI00081FF122|nr:hypothetical protein [Variovorax sp. HW608]SCK49483.1 hypothetical protein VAR608DRAFT_4929 [Variovorax sp. HW608]